MNQGNVLKLGRSSSSPYLVSDLGQLKLMQSFINTADTVSHELRGVLFERFSTEGSMRTSMLRSNPSQAVGFRERLVFLNLFKSQGNTLCSLDRIKRHEELKMATATIEEQLHAPIQRASRSLNTY